MTVSLYFQAEAVQRAAESANTQLTDALTIWSEGDWRTQQIRKKVEHLSAAFETLKDLLAKEQKRPS